MGKASSAKKVAKAQKIGSAGAATSDRKFGFPLAVGLVVVLGIGLVIFARGSSVGEDVAPRLGGQDHWHSAYGIYVCDGYIAEQVDTQGDALGIHTHGDGLMHIHPSSSNAAGENARFGVFADEVGLDLGDDSFTLANGDSFATGEDCDGEESVVRLLKWSEGDLDGEPEVFDSNFGDVRYLGNGEAFALVFAPADAEIPLPPGVANLNNPTDVPEGVDIPTVSIPEDLIANDQGPAITVQPTVPAADSSSSEEAPATTAAPPE
jgi:hypothetical protein